MTAMDKQIDRLYELLPAIYRIRDHEQGQPLRALLQVIAEQVNLVEADIQTLYENLFIETCDDWVVPYLGDLIGYTPVAQAGITGDPATDQGRRLNSVLSPRREVANTLRYRRRKGTLALLEELARDVAGWPAYAQESCPEAVEGRTSGALTVSLSIWRLHAYSVSRTPAACIEQVGPHCYTFSVLGNDAPLFNRPRAEVDSNRISTVLNWPVPIGPDEFEGPTDSDSGKVHVNPDYYGSINVDGVQFVQSMQIWADDWPPKEGGKNPIPSSRIVPADLADWAHVPHKGEIAVDSVRGRLMFPPRQLPKNGVQVSYHYGFSADIGGGEYERPLLQDAAAKILPVRGKEALQQQLKPWCAARGMEKQPQHAVIEIQDSGVYVLPIEIALEAGHSLQIRAAEYVRPVIRLLDWQTDLPDSLVVRGEENSRFTLDGVMVTGRGLRVEGSLRSLTIRHCTLVPGWTLDVDCCPQRPSEPSIELIESGACVVIEHSVVGPIQINNSEVEADPVRLHISDSIVDAAGSEGDRFDGDAIGTAGVPATYAHATMRIERSTLIGGMRVHAIELTEDSLLLGRVEVARRQLGCMRFCYVPFDSRTPRRFACHPDGSEEVIAPQFNSLRYGHPDYCQLADSCPREISHGAHDESEMGVFHDLFQPQRLAALQVRLDEFVPAASEVDVVKVN